MTTTSSKYSEKLKEIFKTVSGLFASKGYHSTSMREIANELGMKKPSLYHYIESKEDLLFKIMNHAMDKAMASLEEICVRDISPEDKLSQVLRFYSTYYAGDQEGLILLVNEFSSLRENYRRILIEKQRHYLSLMKLIFEELDASNKMRDIPHSVATFAFFGMVHYTIKWYQPNGPINVDQLSDYFVKIFTIGICKSNHS